MSLTLPELYDKLKEVDELTLLELLEVNADQIVEAFKDLIDDNADKLEKLFEEDTDTDGN
jgi:hypothetical protein